MNYSPFFLLCRRVNSSSKLAIVRGEKFEECIQAILADGRIEPEYRAFLIVCLCGGLRVSEGLALRKADFEEDGADLYVRINVLKKRRAEERMIRVHPLAVEFVRGVVRSKIGELFAWHRTTCLRKIQSLLAVPGICNHSLRHSAVSYFLFEAHLTREETAKLIHINSKIVDTYAHLDERKVLKRVW